MPKKMRRDSEPMRKARVEERKQLEEAVASLDGGGCRKERPQDTPIEHEPDGAQPFSPHNPH